MCRHAGVDKWRAAVFLGQVRKQCCACSLCFALFAAGHGGELCLHSHPLAHGPQLLRWAPRERRQRKLLCAHPAARPRGAPGALGILLRDAGHGCDRPESSLSVGSICGAGFHSHQNPASNSRTGRQRHHTRALVTPTPHPLPLFPICTDINIGSHPLLHERKC